MESALEAWTDFNVAMAGATAALTGLIIVAMSVNIGKIIDAPALPARAASAIGTLALALVASCFALFPGQPLWVLGLELLVGTAIAVFLQVVAVRRILAAQTRTSWRIAQSVGVLPLIAFSVGTVLLLAGEVGGYVGIAVGCIAAIICGILVGWVELVEILR